MAGRWASASWRVASPPRLGQQQQAGDGLSSYPLSEETVQVIGAMTLLELVGWITVGLSRYQGDVTFRYFR